MEFNYKKFRADLLEAGFNMTTRQMAAEIGVVNSVVVRIRNGTTLHPDLVTFAKVCAWTGYSLNRYFDPPTEDRLKEIFTQLIAGVQMAEKTKISILQKVDKL